MCAGFIRGVGVQEQHHLSILPSFFEKQIYCKQRRHDGQNLRVDQGLLIDLTDSLSQRLHAQVVLPRSPTDAPAASWSRTGFWRLPLRSGWLCTQAVRAVSSIFARFSRQ